MSVQPPRYPEDHWLRSYDSEKALDSYLEQQSKAYSRVKNDFVTELLGNLKGKRVIDYGCGGGFFCVYAAKAGAAEVVGVDVEDSVLSTARYFAEREGVSRQCFFVRNQGFPNFAFKRGFDVILMKDVIEHAPDDHLLLAAASRVLTPGGILLICTQNSISINSAIQGAYHRVLKRDKNWFGWDETHLRFYTPIGLARKLKSVGLKCEAWRSVYIVPYKIPRIKTGDKKFYRLDSLSWIDRTLGNVFPYNRMGWNIIVRARASQLVKTKVRFGHLLEPNFRATPVSANRQSLLFSKKSNT